MRKEFYGYFGERALTATCDTFDGAKNISRNRETVRGSERVLEVICFTDATVLRYLGDAAKSSKC
jgi:hypothetical protein